MRGPVKFEITKHARNEIARKRDTKAYQSIMDFGTGKDYLVRVIVDDTVVPGKVITVYRTSKIDKYWRYL